GVGAAVLGVHRVFVRAEELPASRRQQSEGAAPSHDRPAAPHLAPPERGRCPGLRFGQVRGARNPRREMSSPGARARRGFGKGARPAMNEALRPLQSAPSKRSAHLALVGVASLAFAPSSPLAKAAVGLAPLTIAAGRCAIAAIAITLLFPRATRNAVRGLRPKHRLALPLAGLLLAAHFGLFLGGLATTSLPAAVALVSL